MKRLKAPIRYYGSKGSNGMMKEIYKHFPEKYDVFVEPFCGSSIITLNNPNKKCSEIINDINSNIYSIFKVMSSKELFNEFRGRLDFFVYSEQLYKESKEILKTSDLSTLDRAYHFFLINRMSFSGVGGFSYNRDIRRTISKSTSDSLSTIDGMEELHQRLSTIVVLNRCGIKVIEENNKENIFIYCDPPYTIDTRTSARYDDDMTMDDHVKLLNTLIKSKSKILLSGYDNELYERVLVQENGWSKHSFAVNTVTGGSIQKPKTKTECLWKNYKNNIK